MAPGTRAERAIWQQNPRRPQNRLTPVQGKAYAQRDFPQVMRPRRSVAGCERLQDGRLHSLAAHTRRRRLVGRRPIPCRKGITMKRALPQWALPVGLIAFTVAFVVVANLLDTNEDGQPEAPATRFTAIPPKPWSTATPAPTGGAVDSGPPAVGPTVAQPARTVVQVEPTLPPAVEAAGREAKALYEELLEFRDDPDFALHGLAPCCKYHKWLLRVNALSDRTDLAFWAAYGFAVGDIAIVAMTYVSGGDAEVLERRIEAGLGIR